MSTLSNYVGYSALSCFGNLFLSICNLFLLFPASHLLLTSVLCSLHMILVSITYTVIIPLLGNYILFIFNGETVDCSSCLMVYSL